MCINVRAVSGIHNGTFGTVLSAVIAVSSRMWTCTLYRGGVRAGPRVLMTVLACHSEEQGAARISVAQILVNVASTACWLDGRQ